ncbi:hypothetical protein SO802_010971 [Lithocarpus litseifolius]|uniref:Reverse transcriptase n=1 Tax=Lithocarpus litseifolius TaxID=425828 RepID=A0AAW2DH59_9ROSI
MKHGDRNTKFFHSKATQRRKRNHISGAADQMEEYLNAVPNKVTDNMQEVLLGEFTAEEVKVALFQMGPTKAPGPDDMNTLFYQKFWHIVDDSLLFCQATPKEGEIIAEILQIYKRASGQSINLEKSSAFFSNNTIDTQKQQLLQILGVKEVVKFESYLALPTLIGRDKYHTFAYLKDRV